MLKLVKTIFGCVALIYCVSASAKPFTNEDAINEAKTYVFYCGDTHTKSECAEARKNFIQDYQNAYAGDRPSMIKVTDALWEYRSRSDITSLLDASAWDYVYGVILSGTFSQKESLKAYKMATPITGKIKDADSRFSPGFRLIALRALDIMEVIKAHTVHAVDSDE
ncbi:hypothetical protein GT348_07175 [Aristophania vespae]|uniref:Uncharacterized protein n=1 Tax=Aristophania vespae TaxID=2697033 RepID=A0A6P1NHP3_9PROT|nr:hypothetical protein [Aristophania vespae]QHI96044.1 hypothetical protein GT348_07175 [Aristophania vespae]